MSQVTPGHALDVSSTNTSQNLPKMSQQPGQFELASSTASQKQTESKSTSPTGSSAESSLPLPAWLLDGCEQFPEVYRKASDLVAAADGWVDTNRLVSFLFIRINQLYFCAVYL